MGHLPLGNLRETKYSTLPYRFRCVEPMLKTRFSAVHRFCLYLIVLSMVGAKVFGSPSRSRLQTEMDQPSSFSPYNFNTFSESVTEAYEYITATEVVTDLVEMEVIATETSEMTAQSLRVESSTEEDEIHKEERILKQLLEKGCSLLNRTAYPQKKLRRLRRTDCGAKLLLLSKSGYFLRIDDSSVSWHYEPSLGTDVMIESAHGPGLVRIKAAGCNRYIKMNDAGLLSAVSLTEGELASNVGPTVWYQRFSSDRHSTFNYFQEKGNNVKWYLRAGDTPVQALSKENDNTKFYHSTCNG